MIPLLQQQDEGSFFCSKTKFNLYLTPQSVQITRSNRWLLMWLLSCCLTAFRPTSSNQKNKYLCRSGKIFLFLFWVFFLFFIFDFLFYFVFIFDFLFILFFIFDFLFYFIFYFWFSFYFLIFFDFLFILFCFGIIDKIWSKNGAMYLFSNAMSYQRGQRKFLFKIFSPNAQTEWRNFFSFCVMSHPTGATLPPIWESTPSTHCCR